MGFSFKRWLREFLEDGSEKVVSQSVTAEEFFGLCSEVYIRELAFWGCVNLVGSALSKCRFRTFREGEETKGAEHYLWNYEPNRNQSANAFYHKLAAKLFSENEALMVDVGGQLLIADSYQRQEYALVDDIFTQVTVGTLTFNRSFYQSEVLYFRLSEKDMRTVVNGMANVYQKMIDYAVKNYRTSRGKKGTITYETAPGGSKEEREAIFKSTNKDFRTFAEAENAVMLLWSGGKYTDLDKTTYSNETTRDIRAMIDDVFYFTAKAFGIPPALTSGNIEGTEQAEQQFISYPLGNLINMLEEEIIRKRYGRREIAAGNYLKIDAKAVRSLDLLNFPSGMDKMISSGVYCVNDIRAVLGEPLIDEPWAWKHFITKNYSDILDSIAAAKGGESE